MPRKTHKWVCTHIGWFLLCPVYIGDIETDAPVVIPRPQWLEPWWKFMEWLNGLGNQMMVEPVNPDAVGYLFWGVKELVEPVTIEVEAAND